MHYSSRQILRTMQIYVAWGICWEGEEQAELLFGPATGENEREVLEDPFKCMGADSGATRRVSVFLRFCY